MSTDEAEEVEVLYDYSYSDDQGLVEIHKGEVYRLLEKTNSEWWHVCSLDAISPSTEDDGFFVPAKYVHIVKKTLSRDQEVDSAIFSLDKVLGEEEEDEQKENCVYTNMKPSVLHSGGQSQIQGGLPTSERPPSINGMGENTDTDGDYVNLDQYRADANIPPLDDQNVSSTAVRESDYANLPFQLLQQKQQEQSHSQEQGPRLQDGHFVRILVEGLPWDIYEDQSKRRFFHNRDTGELTWKPPRKDKPSSPVGKGPGSKSAQQPPSFPGPVTNFTFGATEDDEHEEEYTKTEEGADVFFVSNTTNEKWQQLTDESGRQYYHRLGSNDTQWDLPTTPRFMLEGPGSSPQNGETMGEDGTRRGFINRASKAQSMYGKVEQLLANAGDPKACTLPPNFAPGSQLEKSPSLPSFHIQPTSHHRFEDHFSGFLNRTKIAEAGKKKVKKNWAQAFVVMQASNLVFYKDQKYAAQKPGSPHGRPEGVISLQGAKVDFNLPRDITSRRNTIMVSVNSGSQFLLHSDDEKTIREWLVRLKIAANDIAEEPSPREDEGTWSRSGTARRASSEVSTNHGSETGAERGRNLMGIRAKLLHFLSRRPTQEDLIKQGIIKDAVFGSSLQDLCDRDKSPVPSFVLLCITAVESKGLEHDGLYRVSGNLAEIQRLRYAVDKDEDYDLSDEQWDIHTLTGALKLFFRELKEPLFPFKCIGKFLDAVKRDSRKEKLKAFKDALSSLPKCYYETMRVLFQHFRNVVQFSTENRMQTQNMAIVFGPTLMWSGDGDFANMAILTVYQSKVVEFFLLEYENLFR